MLGFYIFQFVPIVLVEGFVLWRMRWGSLRLSLFDSLMMNFVSFLGLVLGLGPFIAGKGPWGLTLFGTYSIMVEGTVLMLLERHPPKLVWSAVLIANLLGCIVLDCEVFFTSIPWRDVLPSSNGKLATTEKKQTKLPAKKSKDTDSANPDNLPVPAWMDPQDDGSDAEETEQNANDNEKHPFETQDDEDAQQTQPGESPDRDTTHYQKQNSVKNVENQSK